MPATPGPTSNMDLLASLVEEHGLASGILPSPSGAPIERSVAHSSSWAPTSDPSPPSSGVILEAGDVPTFSLDLNFAYPDSLGLNPSLDVTPVAGAPFAQNQCAYCLATVSCQWRRGDKGEQLCNACGLYYKAYGANRMLSRRRRAPYGKRDRPNVPRALPKSRAHYGRQDSWIAGAAYLQPQPSTHITVEPDLPFSLQGAYELDLPSSSSPNEPLAEAQKSSPKLEPITPPPIPESQVPLDLRMDDKKRADGTSVTQSEPLPGPSGLYLGPDAVLPPSLGSFHPNLPKVVPGPSGPCTPRPSTQASWIGHLVQGYQPREIVTCDVNISEQKLTLRGASFTLVYLRRAQTNFFRAALALILLPQVIRGIVTNDDALFEESYLNFLGEVAYVSSTLTGDSKATWMSLFGTLGEKVKEFKRARKSPSYSWLWGKREAIKICMHLDEVYFWATSCLPLSRRFLLAKVPFTQKGAEEVLLKHAYTLPTMGRISFFYAHSRPSYVALTSSSTYTFLSEIAADNPIR